MKRLSVVLALVLLLGVVTPTLAAPAESWTILVTHIVQPGETVYCIARAYGVDPNAIITHNLLIHPNYITPGTPLEIPNVPATIAPGPVCHPQDGTPPCPGEPISCGTCTCASVHHVTTGDTLYSISLAYGVNMWSIARCNCIYNLHYIQIGDAICIP
jgi:LysM repeat protein